MKVFRLREFLLASVLGHLCLMLLVKALSRRESAPSNVQRPVLIEVHRTPKERKTQARKRQLVQTNLARKTQTAPKNAFLGAQNQVVEEEKIRVGSLSDSVATTASSRSIRPAKVTRRTSEKVKGHGSLVKDPLSRFALPLFPSPNGNRLAQSTSEEQVSNPGPQEYIKGMRESDRTALNTQEYIFYGYFQRIRERLDHAWVPILKKNLQVYYTSGRHLASDMDHTSRLLVTLNEQGEIIRVKLVEESGVHDLDDAAIRAFNQAGPFPHPPHGIIDSNREVQIPWDFILKT